MATTKDYTADLRMACARIGISMAALCREAGVAHNTVCNWKGRFAPRAETWERLQDAIKRLESKKAVAAK